MGFIPNTTPKRETVYQLFTNTSTTQFIIPVYQRTYVWKAEEQVKQLMDDFYNVVKNNSNHFLGILIVYLSNVDITSSKFFIVDGQQRLTTLFLLILVLRNRALKEGENQIADLLNSCIKIKYGFENDALKLVPLMKDRNIFTTIINNQIDLLSYEDKNSNLYKAYIFITNYVNNTLSQFDFKTLVNALGNLYLVDIPLTSGIDVQQIFETINATGTKLNQTDLIRNFVLMLCPDNNKEKFYNEKRQPFENKFANSSELEKFLRFFMMIETKSFVKKDSVYYLFKTWAVSENTYIDIEEIVNTLNHYADCYNYLYKSSLTSSDFKNEKLRKTLKDLRNIKSDMSAPFLIEIAFLFKDERITMDQFIDCINIVNSFIIRRAIIGMDTSGITRFFTTLIDKVFRICDADDNYTNIVDIVKYVIVNQNEDKASRMPDDLTIIETLKTLNVYDLKDAVHCFFDKYENEKITNLNETMNYQIEHIMPQDGEKWYSIVNLNEEEYDSWKNRFGNLTLTTKHDNPKMSNNLFEYKKIILKGTGQFRCNLDIVNKEIWNTYAIAERTTKLTNEFLRLYPYTKSEKATEYAEILRKSNVEFSLSELLEKGILEKGETLRLLKYPQITSKIVDGEFVDFNNTKLNLKQWVFKAHGIKSGLNILKEIIEDNSGISLFDLWKNYLEEKQSDEDSYEDFTNEDVEIRKAISSEIKVFLKKKNEENPNYEPLYSQNCYIRFASIKIRNIVGERGDGSWKQIKDLIVFELENSISGRVDFKVIIGPGNQSLRRKWLSFAVNSTVMNVNFKVLRNKFNTIYSKNIISERSNYSNLNEYKKILFNNLDNFFKKDILDIENEFINAPKNLDDPIFVEFLNNKGEEIYSEEYHLKNYNKVTNIYNEFKTTLKLLINNLNITCLKHYINFKNAEENICSVEVTKGYLKICFVCNDLKNIDKSILKDVSNLGHLGNGNCIYNLSSKDEISAIVEILRENNLIKNN